MKSTSVNTIIPVIDDIFATFGIPGILKSDNGPPFNSGQLQSYAEHMGFTHRKVTPYWPRANGDAERFMKNMGKIIRAASSEGKPWKQELNKFLRNYRATPHITTGVASAIALFGRQPKIKLPTLPRPINDDQIRKRDAKSKVQMKAYADKHNHARACSYKKGDAVLVKQPRSNKLTLAYDPVPYRITATNGSMITASHDDLVITRNSSFFKKIPERTEDNDRDVNDVELPAQEHREESHQPDAADDPPDEDASLSRPSRERRRPQYLNDYTT